MRKRITIKCPYCHSLAVKRPASFIYGEKNRDQDAYVYVCSRYPFCDAYVAAHKKTGLPMGTLANGELRHKRILAHRVFNRLWQEGYMGKQAAYRWLQVQLGLPESMAHIAMFSEYLCDRVITLCGEFLHGAAKAA